MAVVFALFLGYPAALLADWIKGFSVTVKAQVKRTNMKIDSDNLVQFLNEQTSYLRPHFHEWGYINFGRFGVAVRESAAEHKSYSVTGTALLFGARESAMAHTANTLNSGSALRIGTEFGQKKKCFIMIRIEPDETNPDSGWMKYYFGTALRSLWPSKYLCMVKSVPILQAVMEYYLKQYKEN